MKSFSRHGVDSPELKFVRIISVIVFPLPIGPIFGNIYLWQICHPYVHGTRLPYTVCKISFTDMKCERVNTWVVWNIHSFQHFMLFSVWLWPHEMFVKLDQAFSRPGATPYGIPKLRPSVLIVHNWDYARIEENDLKSNVDKYPILLG